MSGAYIERIIKIHDDGATYTISPNADSCAECIDLAYDEGGENRKCIVIPLDVAGDVIDALNETRMILGRLARGESA